MPQLSSPELMLSFKSPKEMTVGVKSSRRHRPLGNLGYRKGDRYRRHEDHPFAGRNFRERTGRRAGRNTARNAERNNSSEQNGQPPEKPDNDANGTQNAAPQGGQGGNIVFTESGESLTVDLKNAEITKDSQSIDVSDLAEGDYLTVTYGSKNTAEKAEVYTSSGSAPAQAADRDSAARRL